MSSITVEELVNLVSYKLDTASLSRVVRQTERLFKHLDQSLNKMAYSMDMGWAMSMKDMARSSRAATSSIMADAAKAGDAWGKAQPTAKGAGGGVASKGAGGMGLMGAAGRMLGPLAAGFSVFQIGKFAIQSAADLERMTAQFGVMLQSEDKAKAMVASIQKLAASTPLTSMGVTESVKTLLQFGVAGDKAIATVRMLGDVAGGDQERLNRLALAYGQTMSAGKLMGQDLLQYIGVGFNPLKIMAENAEKFGLKAGTSMGMLKDQMSKGKISAEMVTKAFQIATSQGGMFFQNMEKQSKTLGGLWSTLVDNVQLALIKAMDPVIPLLKQFIDWIGKLDWAPVTTAILLAVEAVKLFGRTLVEYGILDSLGRIRDAVAGLFGDGGVTEWANIIKSAAMMVANAFWIISHAISFLSGLIQLVRDNIMFLAPFVLSLGTKMAASFLVALGPIGAVIAALGVLYYAYNRIADAAMRAKSEEEYHAAMVEEAAASSAYATLKLERGKLLNQNRLYDEMGNPNDAGRAKRNATVAKLDELIAQAETKRNLANAKLGKVSAEAPTDPFTSILQNSVNNQKKVNLTQNNTIEMPVTVDTKGETALTPSAVRSIADTAMRSLLNVKLIGVLEAGT